MDVKIPERNKRPGVSYVVTAEGVELPIVDVTHPAFAVDKTAEELSAMVARAASRRSRVPDPVQRLYRYFLLRRSILTRFAKGRSGAFNSGMSTYLAKLGAKNLGDGYARPIDRKIAAGIPFLSVQLRLHHMARLLADGLAPALLARAGKPLHLLNIGGGPAMDSLNALIVLRKENPLCLADRDIFIHILDRDAAGPEFGMRALAALCGDGAALHGLQVQCRYLPYDWSDVTVLRQLLDSLAIDGAVVAVSSEGGLFVYGSDDEVTANLQAIGLSTAADAIVAGSMSRSDGPAGVLNRRGTLAIRAREVEEFRDLVGRAGWRIEQFFAGPLGHNFRLAKIAARAGDGTPSPGGRSGPGPWS